jgi:hypothetical protein
LLYRLSYALLLSGHYPEFTGISGVRTFLRRISSVFSVREKDMSGFVMETGISDDFLKIFGVGVFHILQTAFRCASASRERSQFAINRRSGVFFSLISAERLATDAHSSGQFRNYRQNSTGKN